MSSNSSDDYYLPLPGSQVIKKNSTQSNLVETSRPTKRSPSSFQDTTVPIIREIKPAYQCGTAFPNRGKLVFVHVFKTAGSTMRQLFIDYAKKCSRSVIIVQGCSHASAESIRKGKWKPCNLNYERSRSGKTFGRKNHVTAGSYMERNIDILAGHLRLGSTFALSNSSNNHAKLEQSQDIQFVAFVRNPIDKVVSAMLYLHKGNSMSWYIKYLKKKVAKIHKGGYSDGYSKYLLTPLQMEQFSTEGGTKPNIETRTELILKNIVFYNVTIGVVERMSESLEILHYLMDSQHSRATRSIFKNPAHDNESKKITTSMVMKELEKDTNLYKKMIEYVKYDTKIVTFARQIHEKQFNFVKRMQKNVRRMRQ